MSPVRALAFIGLGANLGDLRRSLEAALRALAALPGTRLTGVSSAYRSAPVEASGPDYLNAVARLETELSPQDLLAALHAIEASHGRERPHLNAPRTLDLDLLLYNELCIHAPGLTLPHPRLHRRAFVLRPLLELAPGLAVTGLGDLSVYLPAVAGQMLERQSEPLSWR